MALVSGITDPLREAEEDLQAVHHRAASTHQEALNALTTWMHRAMVVDAALFKRPGYEALRNQDPAGCALPGVRYAYDRLNHQGEKLDQLVLVQEVPRRAYPRTYPWSYWEITWLPLDRLPPADPKRASDPWEQQKQSDYGSRLAGRPVRQLAPGITRFLLAQAATP